MPLFFERKIVKKKILVGMFIWYFSLFDPMNLMETSIGAPGTDSMTFVSETLEACNDARSEAARILKENGADQFIVTGCVSSDEKLNV